MTAVNYFSLYPIAGNRSLVKNVEIVVQASVLLFHLLACRISLYYIIIIFLDSIPDNLLLHRFEINTLYSYSNHSFCITD